MLFVHFLAFHCSMSPSNARRSFSVNYTTQTVHNHKQHKPNLLCHLIACCHTLVSDLVYQATFVPVVISAIVLQVTRSVGKAKTSAPTRSACVRAFVISNVFLVCSCRFSRPCSRSTPPMENARSKRCCNFHCCCLSRLIVVSSYSIVVPDFVQFC